MANRESAFGITLTQDERESWEAYLDDFKALIFPIFEARGISFETALTLFEMNKTNARMRVLLDSLSTMEVIVDDDPTDDEDEDDESERWRGSRG